MSQIIEALEGFFSICKIEYAEGDATLHHPLDRFKVVVIHYSIILDAHMLSMLVREIKCFDKSIY